LGSSVLCDTFKWTLAFSFLTNFLFPDLTIVIHNNSTQIKTNTDQTRTWSPGTAAREGLKPNSDSGDW